MTAPAWITLISVAVTTIGAIWALTIRYSGKMAVVEEKQRAFEEGIKEKIKEATLEYEKKILALKREMELHETVNNKTFDKLEDKLDSMNSKLDKLLGWVEAQNNK